MTDLQRYERYCEWCRSIGITPAEYNVWRHRSESVPAHMGDIAVPKGYMRT